MKIAEKLRKMKENSSNYQYDMEEHITMAQRTFSACLFWFFVLHIIIIYFLNVGDDASVYAALLVSGIQMLFSLGWYFLFRCYFVKHRQMILPAAYLNIFEVLLLLEMQYYLCDESISYNIIVCIALCTSLTIIGHIRSYALLLTAVLCVDVAITVMRHYEMMNSDQMKLYILDNVFIVIIAVGINSCVCWVKYQEFEKKHQILYLSERDSLTGLLNRKALEQAIEHSAGSQGLCAMILLDLDNFKAVNDNLGHYEGDNCLRTAADELKKLFRSTDHVCRLGGDEFVVFLPDILDTASVMERAWRMRETIPQNYTYEGGEIAVTCSVGVAFLNMNHKDLYECLYKAADSAMYESKSKGKNTITAFSNEFYTDD